MTTTEDRTPTTYRIAATNRYGQRNWQAAVLSAERVPALLEHLRDQGYTSLTVESR